MLMAMIHPLWRTKNFRLSPVYNVGGVVQNFFLVHANRTSCSQYRAGEYAAQAVGAGAFFYSGGVTDIYL